MQHSVLIQSKTSNVCQHSLTIWKIWRRFYKHTNTTAKIFYGAQSPANARQVDDDSAHDHSADRSSRRDDHEPLRPEPTIPDTVCSCYSRILQQPVKLICFPVKFALLFNETQSLPSIAPGERLYTPESKSCAWRRIFCLHCEQFRARGDLQYLCFLKINQDNSRINI